MKKTQAAKKFVGGLDTGARIVYYTIERRRKATHTKRLSTMTLAEIKTEANIRTAKLTQQGLSIEEAKQNTHDYIMSMIVDLTFEMYSHLPQQEMKAKALSFYKAFARDWNAAL